MKAEHFQFLLVVRDYIMTNQLMKPDGKYIVGLSGGSDSVALLLTLKKLGFRVEAAHCNFKLRGQESDRDEQFCIDLCEQEGIPLHRVHFDTLFYAQTKKVSIEMAARDLRYQYFEQLRQDLDATGICIAHHQDDNVETLLINLIRGTGIDGLTGMSPKSNAIIRPLLCVTREQIMDYLGELHQSYVTDSSNLVDDVVRNKIRHIVIPAMENITPAVKKNIAKTERLLLETAKWVNYTLQKASLRVVKYNSSDAFEALSISIEALEKETSPELLLFHILQKYGFSSSQIEQIATHLNVTGKFWESKDYALAINRRYIVVEKNSSDYYQPICIPEEGTYVVNPDIRLKVKTEPLDHRPISLDSRTILVDARKISFPLVVRQVQQGDRFIPFGMKGSKLVSDYLTDIKATIFEKRRQRVLVDAHKNIVWVIGRRADNRYRITGDSLAALKISLLS
jgi:tRNA(Ile)-lysidine synthase